MIILKSGVIIVWKDAMKSLCKTQQVFCAVFLYKNLLKSVFHSNSVGCLLLMLMIISA